MPKVTEEHVEARKRQILEAAVTCFSRAGLHEARLLDIAHEAGVSAGTVYHYFGSKDDIIEALRARSEREELVTGDDVAHVGEPLEALLGINELALRELSSSAARDRNRVAQHLWSEALLNPRIHAGLMEVVRDHRRDLTALVTDAQVAGSIDDSLDPLAYAEVVHAIAIGLQVQHVWEPDAIEFDAVLQVIRALLRPGRVAGEHTQ